ncbi:DUF6702 family protein [Allomuricauda sp. d1]|uniref:DUF6702 family protein n=1 Tax=Allomuricauda sp. d1 TaxID=3136725 RepID=UPI0031D3BDF1
MMKTNRKIVLFLMAVSVLMVSFATTHKFYVSVTNIKYSEEDTAFQVTTRIFIDDLENVLKERYEVELGLATDRESETSEAYIEKYLRSKFVITIDGEPVKYDFLGKRYDNDVAICYIEVPEMVLKDIKTMSVQNEILTDLFEEQKNIVHVKWKDNKKSFVLIKGNDKGMLNF